MGLGEFANFAAYSFAPAILVTPLGALSVIVGAILASVFLGERINTVGKAGCALCLMGSVVVVLNAPRDGDIDSIEQIMKMAIQMPFLTYAVISITFLIFMITRVAGRYGQDNPLVYLSICSVAGSLTVTACKAFGIALKLTFAGNNQFVHFSTYFFAFVVGLCIVVQMNYFNKALEQFDTNIVTPIYYVFFTSATILASVALFQGFNDSSGKELASLFCGFITIFIGVFLLNSTKSAGTRTPHLGANTVSGQHQPVPTDEPYGGSQEFRCSITSRSRRQSHSAAIFDIDDSDEDVDYNGTYPMRERRLSRNSYTRGRKNTAASHGDGSFDSEKFTSASLLNRRHTFNKPQSEDGSTAGYNDGSKEKLEVDTEADDATRVQSGSSRGNSDAANYYDDERDEDDEGNIEIDIPLTPHTAPNVLNTIPFPRYND